MTDALTPQEAELAKQFREQVDAFVARAGDPRSLDVLVGIPFHDEADTVGAVIDVARRGLAAAGLAERSAVVCIGSERGAYMIDAAGASAGPPGPVRVLTGSIGNGFEGRGWCALALAHAAARLRSTLVMLPPNLGVQPRGGDEAGAGFGPHWIARLLEPVRDGDAVALARFSRHPLAQPVESLLAFPVVTGLLGLRARQGLPGVAALSARFLERASAGLGRWSFDAGNYGFEPWLLVEAATAGVPVVEVPLGAVSLRHEVGRLKLVFRQTAHVLFDQLARRSDRWTARGAPVRAPALSPPVVESTPPPYPLSSEQLRRRFWLEFNHYDDTLYPRILPEALRERLESTQGAGNVHLDDAEWIALIEEFLLAFAFEHDYHRDDIVDALFPFFLARLVSLIDEVGARDRALAASDLPARERSALVRLESETRFAAQADAFAARWSSFSERWRERERRTTSYLPRLGAWEFVPNVGIIVPQELSVPGENSVWAYQIYRELVERYREEYRSFVTGELGLNDPTDSGAVLEAVGAYMYRLDRALDADVFPFDLATPEGARTTAERIRAHFSGGDVFCLTPEAAERVLRRVPPANLVTQFGFHDVAALLEAHDPNDALGLAAWTDQQGYLSRVLDYVEKEATPAWFADGPAEVRVAETRYLAGAPDIGAAAALTRLAGRLVVADATPGSGGRLPKLWFFLRAVKSIVGMEVFSDMWRRLAREKSGFAESLTACLRNHWGRRVLSVHNAFENQHQRILVERVLRFAEALAADPKTERAGTLLRAAARAYHLSITLPDGTFVPLSAWTWASHSNRGAVGSPTPLSSLVERDWATHDFFSLYLQRAGRATHQAIDDKVLELVSAGREPDDLREHFLGVTASIDTLVAAPGGTSLPPPARKLTRPLRGPILAPAANDWESRYVLNAAAVRLDGAIYILYRAFGADEVSRIGMAWTRDGLNIDGRLPQPVFAPGDPTEVGGCEDPRLVVIEGRLYMLYTAYDKRVAQIAMASIPVDAFLERRFDQWVRHGLAYPGLANKDAVLYPEKLAGRYAVYHRIDPNMWVSYLDDLACPWPREDQRIIAGPRSGMMWDGVKVGAGAQPIKTTRGWLHIYHGVDFERSYRLGVLFTALDDPAEVLYRSPNAILEPETDYEMGDGDSWVPHVVFTCGAVSAQDKAVLEPDDEVLVYYGAADTVIGVAKGTVRDMVPVIDTLG
jgi:predicted GH43/DUF377 family glycosyl hydrolase